MNIAICCKIVPEEQDIQIAPDRTISYDTAPYKVGDYDLVAIEAAAQLAASCDAHVTAFSIGDDHLENTKLRKGILSRGVDELVAIEGDCTPLDSFQTATALAAAIASRAEKPDLVVCGEGSADLYAQQVGIMLGELLGWATVNAVSAIEPDGASLLVTRSIEDLEERMKVALPAVVCVSSDCAEPRIPSMKDILAAGKKPATAMRLDDVCTLPEASYETVSVFAPESRERTGTVIEGDDDAGIEALADAIRSAL